MASPMTAAETRVAMKKWGVPYKEYPGWTTRTRPGGFAPVGIMIHHTGSDAGQSDDYLYFLFVKGRPEDGIPGPLCNVATDMDGDLHLGAIGRANHAGSGSGTVLNHVVAEDYNGYEAELAPGADDVNGNGYYYGNEVRYDGGQPMTAKQYATAVRWAAAVCDHHGWTALSIIAHREHTRRKRDPGNCPLTKFRTDVAALLKQGPNPINPQEIDMALTQADAELVVDRLLARMVGESTVADCLSRARALALRFGEGGDLNQQLDRIEADVDGLAPKA